MANINATEQAASYIVGKNGSTYYAIKTSDGSITTNADAATLINACITALSSGVIFFKSGTYTITSTISLKNYVWLFGEGSGTTLSFTNDGNCLRSAGTGGSPKGGIKLRDFAILGNDQASQVGVALEYTYSDVHIENVIIAHAGNSGIKLTDCYAIHVNAEISNCAYGVQAYNSHGTTFELKLYANTTNQMILYNCTGAKVSGTSEQGGSIYITETGGYSPISTKVSGMHFESNTRHIQIAGTATKSIVVENCYFFGDGSTHPDRAIVISGNSTGTIIRNNYFTGCQYHAMWIVDATVVSTIIEDNYNDNSYGFINNGGTGTKFRNNIGYVTESGGSVAVANAGTIAHELAATPTKVSVTVNEITPIPVSYTVDATNITVYHSAGGNVTVSWKAEI